jgi:hypothetical protein
MTANTSSREHPFQQQALISPISESMDQSPTPNSTTKSRNWETTVTRIPSWPEEAQTLKKHTWVTYLYGLGDLILVLLPVYFICNTPGQRVFLRLSLSSTCRRRRDAEWQTHFKQCIWAQGRICHGSGEWIHLLFPFVCFG